MTRKGRARRHRPSAPGTVKPTVGVPQFAPTPERSARGGIATVAILAAAPTRDDARDATGDRADAYPRKVVMGYVTQDRTVDVRVRLYRFRTLTEVQIAAAERFEDDWGAAALEPKLTASLEGAGGGQGSAPEIGALTIDARDRVQAARAAIRAAGAEFITTFEAILIDGATARDAGSHRYRDVEKARVHVATIVSAALNLLAAHYLAADRLGRRKRAS